MSLRRYTPAEVSLCIAWLHGEVKTREVSDVLGVSRGGQTLYYVASALRYAARRGEVEVRIIGIHHEEHAQRGDELETI